MVPRSLLDLIENNGYLKSLSNLYKSNGHDFYLVGGAVRDGNMMRRLAVEMNIPFVTTISGAKMEVEAMGAMKNNDLEPVSLNVNY